MKHIDEVATPKSIGSFFSMMKPVKLKIRSRFFFLREETKPLCSTRFAFVLLSSGRNERFQLLQFLL